MARLLQSTMRLLVLPGDGIGPEISRATPDALEAANRMFDLQLEYEPCSRRWTAPCGTLGTRACGEAVARALA
jgi:isocitrate/isopropylmalate dehydrogenase